MSEGPTFLLPGGAGWLLGVAMGAFGHAVFGARPKKRIYSQVEFARLTDEASRATPDEQLRVAAILAEAGEKRMALAMIDLAKATILANMPKDESAR